MFEKNNYVVYGKNGVCQIMDIKPMDLEGISPERLYYVLHPVNSRGSTIFTPVDNERVSMRPIISREEAEKLIDDIPGIETLTIANERLCEDQYKAAMRTGSCEDMVRILKTIYKKKLKRQQIGKKITSVDEKYFHMAENILYTELSILIDVPKEKMEEYIIAKLEA